MGRLGRKLPLLPGTVPKLPGNRKRPACLSSVYLRSAAFHFQVTASRAGLHDQVNPCQSAPDTARLLSDLQPADVSRQRVHRNVNNWTQRAGASGWPKRAQAYSHRLCESAEQTKLGLSRAAPARAHSAVSTNLEREKARLP